MKARDETGTSGKSDMLSSFLEKGVHKHQVDAEVVIALYVRPVYVYSMTITEPRKGRWVRYYIHGCSEHSARDNPKPQSIPDSEI